MYYQPKCNQSAKMRTDTITTDRKRNIIKDATTYLDWLCYILHVHSSESIYEDIQVVKLIPEIFQNEVNAVLQSTNNKRYVYAIMMLDKSEVTFPFRSDLETINICDLCRYLYRWVYFWWIPSAAGSECKTSCTYFLLAEFLTFLCQSEVN